MPPWLVSTDFGTCSYQCFCPIVPLFPCICWSVVAHTLYHVFLGTVLLPVLGMLMLCGLLSHQIVGKVCICYLSLCSIFCRIVIITISFYVSMQKFYRTKFPHNHNQSTGSKEKKTQNKIRPQTSLTLSSELTPLAVNNAKKHRPCWGLCSCAVPYKITFI